MLLTIHGLPYSTKYQDLKQLIKDKCNISDFILDNLVSEGSNKKKVRIGLTDDGDGKLLIKCLDGIRLFGSLLQVVPVSKNQPNEEGTFDRQANTKPSTFTNPPQYENKMQPNETHQWPGNSNQWQPNPVQVNPFNFDSHQSNIYPTQQGSIPARVDMGQLNQHQRDVFPNRAPIQQDHYKAPQQPNMQRNAVLREIQTVDTLPAQNIYQPPGSQYVQNKPLTIKKDLFQGPQSNFDLRATEISGPKQNNTMSWLTPQQQSFPPSMRDIRGPNDRSGRYSPSDVQGSDGRRLPPPYRQNDDRHIITPQGRGKSPQGRKLSPQGRRISPQTRRISPSGRRISPQTRRISPSGRRISPQTRRISPSGRRISPQGRRISPQGRRISPQGRRISPQGRRVSPVPRMSPSRKISPGRQVSPSRRNTQRGPGGYSPTRRGVTDNPNPRTRFDQTRPAAPNQAMYAEGFRGNVHENVQYPVPGARTQVPSWQQFANKPDEDRHLNFKPRATSPRKSRSPVRRGRSPIKDRFKRHSPSPRSPRRSWALEKRRSPEISEAPPPPNWPGSKQDEYPPSKQDKPVTWERNKYDEMQTQESESMRSNIRMPGARVGSPPRRELYNPVVTRYEASAQKLPNKNQLVDDSRRDFRQPHAMQSDDMKHRTDRPDVRKLHKERLDFRQPTKLEQRDRDDFRQPTKPEERDRDEEILQRRLETSKRRDREPPQYEGKKPPRATETLDKELEDIYKRTAEFKKKAEEFRNADERRKEEEKRKNSEFQESLRHNIERDPPRDRSNLRREDRLPESRRFEIDDVHKKSLPRPADRDILRQVDQSRRPQFENNKEGIGKEDLQSRSLDRHDDRREARWADRRDERRDDRSYERPDIHRAERPNIQPNLRLDDHRTERRDERRNERIDDRYSSRVDEHKKQDQKVSREKACSELAERILDRRENKNWKSDLRFQVKESLRRSLMNILNKMFREKEASFIEYTVKFRAYHDENEQDKIFDEVMSSLNSQVRKRPAADVREIQSKALRRDQEHTNINEVTDWDIAPANAARALNNEPMQPLLHYPAEFLQGINVHPTNFVQVLPMHTAESIPQLLPIEGMLPGQKEEINLYLCKDDFECFNEMQLEYLRKFLFCEIERESQNSEGWAPDFSFKPMQSLHRYELKTYDERTKDWIMNINFEEFKFFNVLVYTKEELWYERAAVWLPGHSRNKMEPLTKLKLQNRLVDDLNIEKWKLVKKIATEKGTRLYVDMPPSSARCLEKHKMMLSYELQKVNVFLKALAVDKEAFDKGLLGESSVKPVVLMNAIKNCPIPILINDTRFVKIVVKGSKSMSVSQARKIKEMLLYQVYKYHQQRGKYKTDFLKFGILPPNFFAVLPENGDSKKFLMNVSLGTLNRAPVIVVGRDGDNSVFFRLKVVFKTVHELISTNLITERLRTSNLGVKGLNVGLWKFVSSKVLNMIPKKLSVTYDVDLDSVEAIMKLNYKLDYSDFGNNAVVDVRPEDGIRRLEEKIKKYKTESSDTYEETNMDISGSDSEGDIICLD